MFHVLTLTYLQPLDIVDRTRPEHVAWIQREIDAGRLLLAGRQDTQRGGVLVTADIDTAAAEDLMASDPYHLAGLVSYQRLSFNGALRAPAL